MPRCSFLLFALCGVLLSCAGTHTQNDRYRRLENSSYQTARPANHLQRAYHVASTPISRSVFPPNLPPARAESLIVIDANTGETLAQKYADTRRAVASTQKLLTALVVLDHGNINRRVVIQPEDTRVEPSKLYLKAGDVYSRRQLLKGILIKSANDAAMALARDTAGSVPAFAQLMNRKARQLGAFHSNFINPHGLTASGQYSTARDIARIAYVASKNPFIRQTVDQETYTFHTPRGPKHLKNTNKLLTRMGACTGMKTGYTRASGRCLVTSASLGRRRVILVQLGSETKYIFDDAERLMIWGSGQRGLRRGSFAVAPLTH